MIPKWWKHVIVFSAFTIQMITFGIGGAIGLYSVEFVEHFKVSAAEVSVVGAVNIGVFLGAGPIASYLLQYMSYRSLSIIGSLLGTVGLLAMPFLDNIIMIYAVYGVLVGLGFALVYMPSSILVGLYFDKHKSLACGISTSGSGFGQIVFQPLCHAIIQHYGWKGSIFILAGLMLQCLVCSALLFPLPRKLDRRESSAILNETEKDTHNDKMRVYEISDSKNAEDNRPTDNLYKETSCQTESCDHFSEASNMIQEQSVNTCVDIETSNSNKHFIVLLDFNFQVFLWNNILWNMGINTSWVLTPEYVVKMGLSKGNAATIMTFNGFGCFLGSIIGGGLGNLKQCSRLYSYIIWNLGAGISVMLLTIPSFQTVTFLSCVMFINGIALGGMLGLLVVFTLDLLGEKVLDNAFGYLMLSSGVGCVIGPPIGGLLKDTFGTYASTFYFVGLIVLFGGFLMFLIPIRRMCTSEHAPHKCIEMTARENETESHVRSNDC